MGDTYTRQSTFADGDVITAAHSNDEFNQLLAAFAASSGHTHDGTAGEGGPIAGLLANAITLGANQDADIVLTFDGLANNGVLSWMEDEDYFEFSDDILIATSEKLQFRDTAIYINSSTDGQLDIVADTEIQIAATTIDINGNVDINGTLTIGSAGISEAELEILDGATVTTTELNIIDGDTSASATTVVDADRVVFNDDGAMKQVAVTDLAAYFDDEITAMPNLVSTGALASGSIANGFGTITTTGVITGGTLEATTDTAAGDNAAMGYTAAEGLILTGQGSTNDVTIKNDADADVIEIPTGTTNVTVAGTLGVDGGSSNGVALSQGAIKIKNGGAKSYVDFYCESNNLHYTRIEAAAHATYSGNVTATLPVATGTLALTSEIPTTEAIQDIVGAMVSSNTETNITVTYEDSDGTLDFVVDAAQPNVTSLGTLTSLTVDDVIINGSNIGRTNDTDLMTLADGILTVAGNITVAGDIDVDGTTNLDVVDIDGAVNIAAATTIATNNKIIFRDAAIHISSTADGDLSIVADDEIDLTSTLIDLNGNVEISGTAAITGIATFTDDIIIGDGKTIGSASDVDAMTIASNGQITLTQTLIGTALNISGNIDAVDGDFDGTLEADAITIGGTAIASIFSPIAGGTGILTTGALDTGSITSGFGTINNGASTITTTGAVNFGAATVDSLDASEGNITNVGSIALDSISSDTGNALAIVFNQAVSPNTHIDTSAGGSTAPDFSQYTNFVWTLTSNLVLTDPGDEVAGQSGVFVLIQDAGGTNTISTAAAQYFVPGATELVLSTTGGAVDVIPYMIQADGKILLGAVQLAFGDV